MKICMFGVDFSLLIELVLELWISAVHFSEFYWNFWTPMATEFLEGTVISIKNDERRDGFLIVQKSQRRWDNITKLSHLCPLQANVRTGTADRIRSVADRLPEY